MANLVVKNRYEPATFEQFVKVRLLFLAIFHEIASDCAKLTLVEQVARTAFEKYDNIENLSGMRIAVVNRFDFGLASGNLTRGAAWSMEDWQRELEN